MLLSGCQVPEPDRVFVWNNYGFGDEYELCIEYCTNLTILGEGAQILTEPHFTLDGCDSFSWESKLMDPYSCFNGG